MLIDNKILQRHGIYDVLAESQTVVFRDQSIQRLHFVQRNGIDDIYLRALEARVHQVDLWCVFDLRRLDHNFDGDLKHVLHRDRPGMVMFGLRALFASASGFEAQVSSLPVASWFGRQPMPPLAIDPVQTPAMTFQPELRRAVA